jgi:hypothetical protein
LFEILDEILDIACRSLDTHCIRNSVKIALVLIVCCPAIGLPIRGFLRMQRIGSEYVLIYDGIDVGLCDVQEKYPKDYSATKNAINYGAEFSLFDFTSSEAIDDVKSLEHVAYEWIALALVGTG